MQEVRVITQVSPGGDVIRLRPDGVNAPQTRQEFEALHFRRAEFNEQIGALRRRRNELDEQRHVSGASQRPLLQTRIEEVDARILRLEGQLDLVNDQIAAAPAHVLSTATTARPGPGDVFLDRISRDLVPITGILAVFFLAPLALGFLRLMWKRSSAPSRPALADAAAMQRLEQLQQSVDAMAIEVERISEGQRFVSKLMHEREPQLLGARPEKPANV